MTRRTRASAALALLPLVLAACTTGGTAVSPAPTTPEAPPPPAGVSAETAREPWRTLPMTDVRSGESFTVADLAGRVVVMQPMAIWCTSCARQHRESAQALAALDREDVVYISLTVDPGESAADLAAYADRGGYDWRFVVAGRELSRALAEAFGDQVLSPPATPRIVVTPDGEAAGPTFGVTGAAALEAELREHLS
jgi:cytochrome oxidase Cu insertion factor (SCO1/SenC/PrrC family)